MITEEDLIVATNSTYLDKLEEDICNEGDIVLSILIDNLSTRDLVYLYCRYTNEVDMINE